MLSNIPKDALFKLFIYFENARKILNLRKNIFFAPFGIFVCFRNIKE